MDRVGPSRVKDGRGRRTKPEAAGQRVDRTGLDFPESQRAVEDRQSPRQLVREWTGLDFPESRRAVVVREWTGLDFPESQRAVEDGQSWRKLVREWTGQDWTLQSHSGQWKTDRAGGSWSESGQDWIPRVTEGRNGQIGDMTELSRVTEGRGRQARMEAAGQRVDRAGLSKVTEGRGRQTGMEAAGQSGDRTGLSRVKDGRG